MHKIKVGDIEVNIVRKNIKNLHLGVYPPTGRVRIATPLKIDDDAVRLFIISKIQWIKKQQSNFNSQERQKQRDYVSGESHYFNGKRYLLHVIEYSGPSKVEIKKRNYIDLFTRQKNNRDQKERIMDKWYRDYLKKQIPPIINKWEKSIGVNINYWGIRKMRTRWGTCNIKAKRIWLNLELAKKPLHCLEFIILHEIVHILEKNHNELFKSVMDKFLPRWRQSKEELKESILPYANWKY